MAVTENMLIDLQVKTGNSDEHLKKISENLSDVSENTAKTSKEIQVISGEFYKLSKMLSTVSTEINNTAKVISSGFTVVDKDVNILNSDIAKLNSSVVASSQQIKKYNAVTATSPSMFTSFSESVRLANANLIAFTGSISAIIAAFKVLTDPKTLKMLSDVSNVLAALALSKGMTGTANALREVGVRLDGLSEKSGEFRDNLSKNWDGAVSKTRFLNGVLENLGVSFAGLAGIIGTFPLGKFISQTEQAANVQSKFVEKLAVVRGVLKRGYEYVNQDIQGTFSDTISVIDKVNSRHVEIQKKTFGYFTKTIAGTAKSLHAIDLAAFLAPAMILIGGKLKESENAFIRWSGTVIKTIGIVSTGFMGLFGLLAHLFGNFAINVGTNLIASVEEANQKFIKFQDTMLQFKFVLLGFIGVFGQEAIGTLGYWNQTMEKMNKETIYTREEIAKSIKLLIAEGQVMGLTVEENTKLLTRAADVAAATGRDLFEVTQMILTGLTNNADAVLSLGIDIRNTSLAHSKYVEEAGIAVEQMNAQELAMARLNAMYEKTIPLVGASGQKTQSLAGANRMYEKTVEDISLKIGKAGKWTELYLRTVTKFMTFIKNIPQPILTLYANLKDMAGVLLIITGHIIKLGTVLLLTVSIIKLLNFALASFFGFTLPLTTILMTMAKVIMPVVAGLVLLNEATTELIYESKGFTETFAEIGISLGIYKRVTDEATESTSALANVFSTLFKGSVGLVKLALIGLAQTINVVSLGIINLKKTVESDQETLKGYDWQINQIEVRLADLTKASLDAKEAVGLFGGGVAYASEKQAELSKETEKSTSLAGKFRERVLKLAAEINSEFDKNVERQRMLGNEFEKAIASYKQSENELKGVFKTKSGEREVAQKYADAERKSIQASLEMEKLRLDTLKKITEQRRGLETEVLRTQGRNIAAIKLERDEQLRLLDEQIAGLRQLGKIDSDEFRKIQETRSLIVKSSEMKILDERNKFNQKAIEAEKLLSAIRKDAATSEGNIVNELKAKVKARIEEIDQMEKALKASNDYGAQARKSLEEARSIANNIFDVGLAKMQADKLKELEKANQEYNNELKSGQMTQVDLINMKYLEEQKVISEKLKELEIQGLLSNGDEKAIAALQKQLALADELSGKKREAELAKAPSESYDKITTFGKNAAESISGVFKTGMTGMAFGAMGAANTILDAIEGILDFIPNALNKIAGIFDKATALPDAILKAVKNVARAIPGFIKDFLPNFFRALPEVIDEVINLLATGIPDAFVALVDALPDIFVTFAEKIPLLAEKFMISIVDNLPKLISVMITLIVKALPKMVFAFLKMFYSELPKAIIRGIVKGIESLKNIFKGISMKSLAPDTKKVQDSFKLAMKDAQKTLTGESSKLFAVLDLGAAASTSDVISGIPDKIEEGFKKGIDDLTKFWHQILAILRKWWDEAVKIWRDLWDSITRTLQAVWDGIISVWRTLWDMISAIWNGMVALLQGAFDFIKAVWDGAIAALTTVFDFLKQIWDGAVNSLSGLWESIKGIFDRIVSSFGGIVDTLSKLPDSIKNAFSNAIDSLKNIIEEFKTLGQKIWNGLKDSFDNSLDYIKGLGKKIAEGFKEWMSGAIEDLKSAGRNIFDGFSSSLSSLGDIFANFGKNIWNSLSDGIMGGAGLFSKMGAFIWDGLREGIDRLGGIFTDLFDRINPGNLFERMFKIDMMGRGTVEKTLGIDIPYANFAQGGVVPGNALLPGDSPMNDRILALLSPGEAVIPRSLMENKAIKSLVEGVLSGNINPPAFQIGGTIGTIIKTGGQVLGDLGKGITGALGGLTDIDIMRSADELQQILGDGLDILSAPIDQLWKLVEKEVFRMIFRMFSSNKFHSGGLVPSFAGGGEVPALLNPGEFVMNRGAVSGLGTNFLNSLNSGKQSVQPNITINIEIETTQPIDETFFRNNLMPRIKDDIKRRTLNGEFIVSSKGVR